MNEPKIIKVVVKRKYACSIPKFYKGWSKWEDVDTSFEEQIEIERKDILEHHYYRNTLISEFTFYDNNTYRTRTVCVGDKGQLK